MQQPTNLYESAGSLVEGMVVAGEETMLGIVKATSAGEVKATGLESQPQDVSSSTSLCMC